MNEPMSTPISEQCAPNEEALIDAALAALEQASPPPTPLFSSGREPAPDGTVPTAAATAASPTLDALDASRRPQAATVCERCPNSVWFASPMELKCYCRVMFLVTWSSAAPNQITHCDGALLGAEG